MSCFEGEGCSWNCDRLGQRGGEGNKKCDTNISLAVHIAFAWRGKCNVTLLRRQYVSFCELQMILFSGALPGVSKSVANGKFTME